MIFIGVLTLAILSGADCDRVLSSELNPGCNDPTVCKDAILVHVKAEGENDTLHHLWDFAGKPSLLIALTDKDANLSIQWLSFLYGEEDSVKFDPKPKYVYGVLLDKVIEFNDADDLGYLNTSNANSSYVTLLDTKNFNWKLTNLTNSSGECTLTVTATDYKDNLTNVKKNGSLDIVVSAYGAEAHGGPLPHLLHSGNASQLDLVVNGLTPQYNSSRYGLGLITLSSDAPNSTIPQLKHRQTLDDEHAPGVFTIIEMLTPAVVEKADGGYVQWRPVVYTSDKREMTGSTETMQYPVSAPESPRTAFNHTLLSSTFGPRIEEMLTMATNVTFGVSKDGFYNKEQYAAWSMVIGYGQPPEEKFSMLVTLVLLIGLGLPAILILTGTVCIVVRRLQRNKETLYLAQ